MTARPPDWMGMRASGPRGTSVLFDPCGQFHDQRVPFYGGRYRPLIRRQQGRPSWRRARWHCRRPARHDGPCQPWPTPADATDVLLARWKARR